MTYLAASMVRKREYILVTAKKMLLGRMEKNITKEKIPEQQ